MKFFMYDVEKDNGFDDEILSLDEAIEVFSSLSDEKGSFFGIKTKNQQIIQFSWEDDIWLVDIPLKSTFEINQVSLQKYANYDECINIIKNTYNNRSINNLFKVLVMDETLDEVKSRTITTIKYGLDTEGIENIKEELVYNGWEKGLFLYWSYKNNLLTPQIQKLIELHSDGLESLRHELLLKILRNSIGDNFNLVFYTEKSREFILDYIYFSTEEYDLYIDIEKLYPNINATSEIPEIENEYNRIMKKFDSRYEEYQSYNNF